MLFNSGLAIRSCRIGNFYLNLYLDTYHLNCGLNFLIDVLEGIFIVRNVRSIFSVK